MFIQYHKSLIQSTKSETIRYISYYETRMCHDIRRVY